MIFENIQSAQGLVAPVMDAFTRHGGSILDNEAVVPHAASYLTELEKAFASSPQCIFIQTDPTTTGTLWANARELGHLNVPYCRQRMSTRTPMLRTPQVRPDFSKWATGMLGAAPAGPSWTYFEQLYKGTLRHRTGVARSSQL